MCNISGVSQLDINDTLLTSLKRNDAYGVYQTPSVASRHVLKERPECLKIAPNLEFSLASVMFRVTFEPENRV